MAVADKLPRLLKEPTGWIIIALMAGFLYVQWPTRVREVIEPEPVWQTLETGFTLRWEDQPLVQSEDELEVWGLTRKGMSFLLQTAPLTEPFDQLVSAFAAQDRKIVGGAVQEPLSFGEQFASYAFFDAESRIQSHRVYLIDGMWIKVSVLYKPSMESRVQRAQTFFEHLGFKP